MTISFLPDLASLTIFLTLPPTPAIQDISACPVRSSLNAMALAICAAEEHPEHEYTRGFSLFAVTTPITFYFTKTLHVPTIAFPFQWLLEREYCFQDGCATAARRQTP